MPTDELRALLDAATEAMERLDEQREHECEDQANLLSGQDGEELQAQHRAVNRYGKRLAKISRWLTTEMLLTIDGESTHDNATLCVLIAAILEGVLATPASSPPIAHGLLRAEQALGPRYREAHDSCLRLIRTASSESRRLMHLGDDNAVKESLLALMHAGVEFLDVLGQAVAKLRGSIEAGIRMLGGSTAIQPNAVNGTVQAQTDEERELPAQATPKIVYRFQRCGDFWDVRFGGEAKLLAHQAGLQHIATLLVNPWRSIPVGELADKGEQKETGRSVLGKGESGEILKGGGFQEWGSEQEASDQDALSEYEQTMRTLAEQIGEAPENLEHEKVETLQQQMEEIAEHVDRDKALGGKTRKLKTGTPTEKPKETVKRAINRAFERLRKGETSMPALRKHLRNTIQPDGNAYCYRPSPTETVTWEL